TPRAPAAARMRWPRASSSDWPTYSCTASALQVAPKSPSITFGGASFTVAGSRALPQAASASASGADSSAAAVRAGRWLGMAVPRGHGGIMPQARRCCSGAPWLRTVGAQAGVDPAEQRQYQHAQQRRTEREQVVAETGGDADGRGHQQRTGRGQAVHLLRAARAQDRAGADEADR